MDVADPVSCLLCLDAYERSEMLYVQLRPIDAPPPSYHYICPRCGGAIAAEYLYKQNKGKADQAGSIA